MFRLLNPPLYQGPGNMRHRKGYFEGWYYKFVTTENRAFAVIPGVSLKKGDSTAFIQTIDGTDGSSTYHTFNIDEFEFSQQPFAVSIGENRFSLSEVVLGDRIPLKGQLKILNPLLYKSSLKRPGIMGWYRYVPFMECYHGVVSMGHGLEGELDTPRGRMNFDRGSGYIEKDWGTSFPTSYIWMQSNSFRESTASFMLSLARIPWFGSWFPGFLGFLNLEDRALTFSTYTGAKLKDIRISDREVSLRIEGRGRGWNNSLEKGEELIINASRKESGILIAPQTGAMDRRISESIDGRIEVEFRKEGTEIFRGQSENSGLEIVGNTEELKGFS